MIDTVDNLILDLVEWVGQRERTYQETMDAWRTSCPRLPVWEDACDRGFVERAIANNRVMEMQMRVNRRQLNASAIVAHQELKGRQRLSLDVALRYSPSFLLKGLVIENVECVFINGLPKPSILAKDIAADDVGMVEVYNWRGAVDYRDREMFRRNGQGCGVGPLIESFGSGGLSMRSSRPPKDNTVAYILIWLK